MSRTVLTTGANSGLGLATVLGLARAGFRSVGSVRSEAKAAAVRIAARAAGVDVATVILDVTDPASCEGVIEEVRPWGLVNNAGYGATGAVEDVDDEEARAVLETMVIAPLRLARLSLRHMREAGEGRIVNMSSIYGRTTTPLAGWYQGSKHALEALSDALRMEVASRGVDVILVEPGGFRTAIWEENAKSMASRKGSSYGTAYRRSLELLKTSERFLGEPERVAAVVAQALSARWPRARYLVGYDAQLLGFAEPFLPTAVKDWVMRRTLGL